MEMERISKYVGNQSMSIVDAMAKIDANTKGILFIIDDNQTLVGALTDGDIRRWILNSGEVSAAVSCAMNKSPKYLKADTTTALTDQMSMRDISNADYAAIEDINLTITGYGIGTEEVATDPNEAWVYCKAIGESIQSS